MCRDYAHAALTFESRLRFTAYVLAAGSSIGLLFYDRIGVALLCSALLLGFFPLYRRHVQSRRQEALLLQFRDVLYALSSAVSAGRPMIEGLAEAQSFCRSTYDETVVLLSHKKADSYIHIDVEFGEGEGKIPVDSIAKRAEAYKPKEKVTYKMIKEYIEAKYGFKVHTAYIAEVKRNLGLPMYDAPNAVEELKQPRKHPTPEKVEAIKDALRYFAVI